MEITEEQVRLADGAVLSWSEIVGLKSLNDRLVLQLKGGISLEISGLNSKEIDSVYTAYSRHMRQHHLATHR